MFEKIDDLRNTIICGDAKNVLKQIPDESIDCIITSPPYFGLRDYGVTGQIGLEDTSEKYINRLMGVFSECKRVLKKTGTFWLNIGDTYGGTGAGHENSPQSRGKQTEGQYFEQSEARRIKSLVTKSMPKCLLMMPERLAFALINEGFILRNKIIWKKNNPMPSSVKDRFNTTWEYMYFFSKSRKYFFDLDAVREKHAKSSVERSQYEWVSKQRTHFPSEKRGTDFRDSPLPQYQDKFLKQDNVPSKNASTYKGFNKRWKEQKDIQYDSKYSKDEYGQTLQGFIRDQSIAQLREQSKIDAKKLFPDNPEKQQEYINMVHDHAGNPSGKNPGDFWEISTQAFSGAHFAVFPERLVETPIKAGCPEFVCRICGKPRERISDKDYVPTRPGLNTGKAKSGTDLDPNKSLHERDISKYRMEISYHTMGWSDCSCQTETGMDKYIPGVVIDPFAGSGTVGLVARKLLRDYILIDLKQDYVNMARKRLDRIPVRLDTYK